MKIPLFGKTNKHVTTASGWQVVWCPDIYEEEYETVQFLSKEDAVKYAASLKAAAVYLRYTGEMGITVKEVE